MGTSDAGGPTRPDWRKLRFIRNRGYVASVLVQGELDKRASQVIDGAPLCRGSARRSRGLASSLPPEDVRTDPSVPVLRSAASGALASLPSVGMSSALARPAYDDAVPTSNGVLITRCRWMKAASGARRRASFDLPQSPPQFDPPSLVLGVTYTHPAARTSVAAIDNEARQDPPCILHVHWRPTANEGFARQPPSFALAAAVRTVARRSAEL